MLQGIPSVFGYHAEGAASKLRIGHAAGLPVGGVEGEGVLEDVGRVAAL